MKSLLILISFLSLSCFAKSEIGLELGSVQNTYNRVAIPGDDGTAFDLDSSFDNQNFYHRLTYAWKGDSPHGFRLLYAPLKLSGDKKLEKNVDFSGVTFNKGEKTHAEYVFNSYRASYFYEMLNTERYMLRLGVTAKVRDAKVELKQSGKNKFKKNTGVVPLFYLFSEYKITKAWRLALDFDGWAAPQGRAFDVGLMSGYYVRDNLSLNLGYRILEGGADNDTVYNFSKLEYLFSSIQLSF